MYTVIMFAVRLVRRILSVAFLILFVVLALLAGAVYGLGGGIEWTLIIFGFSLIIGLAGCALWPLGSVFLSVN